MKNRNFVYLLVFIFTLTLAAPALAADEPPPQPSVRDTKLTVESATAVPETEFTLEATLEGETEAGSGTYETLSEVDVEFTFEGTTETGTTGTDGVASVTFTAPATKDTYDYTASVDEFQKDGNNYDWTEETETVTVTGAEVRAGDLSEEDHLCSRVKGYYSLNEIGDFTDPDLKGNRVYLYTLIHTLLPGVV